MQYLKKIPKSHLFPTKLSIAMIAAGEQEVQHPFQGSLKNALVLMKEKALNF